MLNKLLYLPRYQKRLVSMSIDSLCLPIALWLALSLRLDLLFIPNDTQILFVTFITVFSSIFIFARLGLYRAVIRYMSNHAMLAIIAGVSFSALVLGN